MPKHVPVRQHYQHFIPPIRGNALSASVAVGTSGRIFASMFEVQSRCRVTGIRFANGATVAGNVRVAIYGPVTNDTMTGATLVVESADTALSGASTEMAVSLTETALRRGTYYACLQFDGTTHTIIRSATNAIMPISCTQRVDQTYGAYPATAPAMTNDQSISPLLVVVVSTP